MFLFCGTLFLYLCYLMTNSCNNILEVTVFYVCLYALMSEVTLFDGSLYESVNIKLYSEKTVTAFYHFVSHEKNIVILF